MALALAEHRIAELRTTWAGALPGKVLVVLDPERMLAENVFLTEDGHAQERSLLDEVIATILPCDLWIADRNFCTLKFLFEIARRLGCRPWPKETCPSAPVNAPPNWPMTPTCVCRHPGLPCLSQSRLPRRRLRPNVAAPLYAGFFSSFPTTWQSQ